ncbi:MAG: NAD(P)H-dependent oxidoreductase [Candidatus Pacebacteria bacterium]|nr:NAD(P)H-dependent oxidoreductase [Candidatus Paceibacterota bacterium]
MKKQISEKEIIDALNTRYAVKIFDKNKKISNEELNTILESGRLSPSSLGLEPWNFIVVNDLKTREAIYEYSKQPKVLDASHLIILTYKTNLVEVIKERLERTAKIQNQKLEELESYKKFLEDSTKNKTEIELQSWLKAQTYIPLGIMTLTASLLGIDNCPMEGFQNEKIDEILNLKDKNLKSVTMLALGQRGEDPNALKPKIRKNFEEAITIV